MASKLETVLEELIEEKVNDSVENAMSNHDFSGEVESEVERAMDNYDFASSVDSALDDYDFGDVIQRVKDDIQEEVTDELKDTIYAAMLKKLEPLLAVQQAGLVPVGNDNAEARPRVRVILTLTFERDYIADCVKIGKANPTAEELQWLIRHSLQPFLKQEGEVVTEPPVAATEVPTVTEPAKEVA